MNADSIEKAKKHWQLVADSIPILLCLVDSKGLIVRANRTLERWGLGKVSTVKGRSLHEVLHPECALDNCVLFEFEQEALTDIASGHRTKLETFDPILKRHLAISVQSTLIDENRPNLEEVMAVVAIDDLSELKRSEEHILQQQSNLSERIVQEMSKRMVVEDVQARLLNILSKTPNFIAMADLNGTLLYLNHAGRTMLQLGNEQLGKLTMSDCLTPEARLKLKTEVIPSVQHKGVWSGPATLQARDGHEIPTTQVVIAHRDKNGQMEGISIVEQDMTAWVHSETALRNSQEELRQLSSQLLNVQEDERRRIAADLHDVIGQSLSLIKLSIDNASRMIREGATEDASNALIVLSARVKDALVEVRRISMDLRPTTLDDLGILPTLSWFFREFEATCRNIKVIKEFSVNEGDIPSLLKTTIFRLLQEATANIVKHSGANQIGVSLIHRNNVLQLAIEDNGQGFDTNLRPDSDAPERGLGLRSMKERTRLSGGIYVLESIIGQGTSIRASWPIITVAGN